MIDFAPVRQKMESVLAALRQDLLTIKTGRATPAMIEKITVEAYDTKMPLVELAMISVPDANQLVVSPFDQTILKNIEKALAVDRNLGLSPIVDGEVIRLKIPPLTEERRKEFVKVLGQKLEAGRIMIRQVRGEEQRRIRAMTRDKELNEDEAFRAEGDLQKITDDFNQKIEEVGKVKEAEILGV